MQTGQFKDSPLAKEFFAPQNFWVLMLIALVVLGAGLGLRDPWPADEPRFAQIARQMVESGQWLFPFRGGEIYPDKPPMLMWFIGAWYWLTGSLKVSFLLPSLLSGLGVVALIYDLGRRLWNQQTGFQAGLLLIFIVQFTLQTKTAQIDALVTFFIILGVYGFLRFYLTQGGWRFYYLGWFAAGLGVITKGVGILALFVPLTFAIANITRIRELGFTNLLKTLLGPVCLLLACSIWFVPMYLTVEASNDPVFQAYRDNILFKQTGERYANAWHHIKPFYYYLTNVIPFFWLPASILLVFAVKPMVQLIKEGDKRWLLMVGYLLLCLAFFSYSPGKRGVYMTPLTPILALALAPLLPLIMAKLWPSRVLSGLSYLLAVIPLIALAILMVNEKAQVAVQDLAGPLWPMLTSWALCCLVVIFLLRNHNALYRVYAVLAVVWAHYTFAGYHLINPVRTPEVSMNALQTLPKEADVLVLDFREQHFLFAQREIFHFSYKVDHSIEVEAAAQWMKQKPQRYILGGRKQLSRCFDDAQLPTIEKRHSKEWVLVSEALLLETCKAPESMPPVYHFENVMPYRAP
ncbi:ArnT family glycosyltransferase [Paraferrimonas haliotis]|uniref:Glycosyl transferase n=1 Tax=Paraferrimonas haliotis TaxID=2013866 RepID=A0AA37TTN6_9GAMM|nr:glycosyltransferase family 39 protein [Paraferrimonas haliotis]GLS84297.1 glycosyl transferase [Paraferrimonas haliotis]